MLLMDEPFGALDAITRSLLQEELLRLKAALRKTIVFVTHDIIEALILGDRIAVMNGGRLEQIAERRELLRHPATAFVETLLERVRSQMAALEGVMRDGK
jgi:osmoprotectant transport system ATP-binding protein